MEAPEIEERSSSFKQELTDLVNRHSIENHSNTPDYIIAEYLVMCYGAFCAAVSARDVHEGKEVSNG